MENLICDRCLFFWGHCCSRGRVGQKYKISMLVLNRQMVRRWKKKKKNHCHWPATSYQIARYSRELIRLLSTVCAITRPASQACVEREIITVVESITDLYFSSFFQSGLGCCLQGKSTPSLLFLLHSSSHTCFKKRGQKRKAETSPCAFCSHTHKKRWAYKESQWITRGSKVCLFSILPAK